MDVAQLALAVEDLHGPFPRHAEVAREVAEELDDLCDVVVVFAVFGSGLWIEEVVAGDELEDLDDYSLASDPKMNKGERSYHASHAPDVCTGPPFRA